MAYHKRVESFKIAIKDCIGATSPSPEHDKSLTSLGELIKQSISKDVYMEADTAFREILAESLENSSSKNITKDSYATKLIAVALDIGPKIFVTSTVQLG